MHLFEFVLGLIDGTTSALVLVMPFVVLVCVFLEEGAKFLDFSWL